MKAIITLTDTGNGGFKLETIHRGGYSSNSPAHVASYKVMECMEQLAKKRGQDVENITNKVTAAPLQERTLRQQQALEVYEWLGTWREQLPIQAVAELQDVLGPLPEHAINLDALVRPKPGEEQRN